MPPADSAQIEAERLLGLFQEVELPEIEGVAWHSLSPSDIASRLPPYGGKHPMKGILVDRRTVRAFGIASGWDSDVVIQGDWCFRSGSIRPEVAEAAGEPWRRLGNHLEGVAAAFMRKSGFTEADLYISGRNPCWGDSEDGCFFSLPIMLAVGTRLVVWNKYGADSLAAHPDRRFHFVGSPDS